MSRISADQLTAYRDSANHSLVAAASIIGLAHSGDTGAYRWLRELRTAEALNAEGFDPAAVRRLGPASNAPFERAGFAAATAHEAAADLLARVQRAVVFAAAAAMKLAESASSSCPGSPTGPRGC